MKENACDIRNACLRLLAVRDHSKTELLNKLAVKGFDKAFAQTVVDELTEEGWQDDSRYAESYARSRIVKGYGPVRITYELRLHGIELGLKGNGASFDLEAIAQAEAGGWGELLERVYRKKYRPVSTLTYGEWSRRSRFLTQRGFSGDMIAELFKRLNIQLI